MNNIIKKKSNTLFFSEFAFYISEVFLLLGKIQYGSFSVKALAFCTVLFWFFCAFLEKRSAIKSAVFNTASVWILVSIATRFVLLAISPYGVLNSLQYIFVRIAMYMAMIAFMYYRQCFTIRSCKRLLRISLIIWLTAVFFALKGMNFDISIGRLITAGLYKRENFGSLLDLVIGSACIALAFYGTRKRIEPSLADEKHHKYIYIFWFFVFLIIGYYTQSFISLFLSITMLVCETLFPNQDKTSNKKFALLLTVLCGLIIIFVNLSTIGKIFIDIAPLFGKSIFSEKFTEIGTALRDGENTGDLSVRLAHLATTFNAFFKYPLFGNSPIYGYTLDHTLIGRHSGLDIFARFGIFGGGTAVWGYYKYLLNSRAATKKFLSGFIIVMAVIYMILSGWEHVEGLFALTFFAPLICYIYSNLDKE